MANIRERKDRNGKVSYCVQIRHQGQPQQSKTFPTLKAAKAWATKQEGAYIEGRYFPEKLARTYTVSHLLDRYISEVLPRHKTATAKMKRQHLEWWRERIGTIRLADLSADHIVSHRAILACTHAPGTVNNYCKDLSVVLRLAVRSWRWLHVSPLGYVDRLKEPRGRTRFLTMAERDRLLPACKLSQIPHLYEIVVLALGTGGRKQELLDLEWEAVDLERQRVTFFKTKNDEIRSVPLTGLALQILQEKSARGEPGQSPYVFPGTDGPWVSQSLHDAWSLARKRAGIKNFRFHDLRHTFASYMLLSGATLGYIQKLLGHKTLKMVLRYAHLELDQTREAVERMSKTFLSAD